MPKTLDPVIDPPSSPTLPLAEASASIHEEEGGKAEGKDDEEKWGDQGDKGEDEEEKTLDGEDGEGDDEPAGDDEPEGDDEAEDDREDSKGEETESVGGDIPEDVNAEERVGEIVDEDDGDDVGTKRGVDVNEEEPEREGLKEIVVLEVGSDIEETPVDERLTRRTTRRSRQLDEGMAETRARKLQFGTSEGEEGTGEGSPETQETPGKEEEVPAEAVEKRYATERKRKGKQEARPLKKQHRQASSTLAIKEPAPEPIRVPFAKETEEVHEEEEEEETNPEEEPVFEMTEVLVTKKLLEAMVHFEDPKKALICEGRASKGKLAKSGKRFHPESLREIESEGEFLSYISAIGFEWLLGHSTTEVPIALAKEFFTSYKFKSTLDPDADSISFRLFNEEVTMSIREWSLRMGLFTPKEDEEGIWNEREMGPPKKTPGFDMQKAWELITHERGGVFKTSVSKGVHITNPVLRLAQVFLGYNLLGQASSTLTTPELYFTWCMLKGVKVHLGYWLAQACHLMTTHTVRHLYTCHLLGAYLKRNVIMKLAKSVPTLPMCDAPEQFNLAFFFNKGLLRMKEGEIVFYEVGKPEVAVKMEDVEVPTNAEREEWRREIGEVRSELSSAVVGLKGALEVQTEKMAEAITLMMRMVTSVERRLPPVQQLIPPRPSGEPQQPAPGAAHVKRASGEPTGTPSKKRKEVTTTTTTVPVKKDIPKAASKKDDEPAPPPPKKTKTAAGKSGPSGDQTQN